MRAVSDDQYGKLSKMVGMTVEWACPECGAKMLVRQNRTDKSFFLGCSAYPACQNTSEIPESIRMELYGQPRLF